MAFMRMMGRDSVVYHQATVLGRVDDHAGQSLDYYGTRGETPLVWGGAGAGRLGLDGRVTQYTYAAIFGASGATDPVTGDRLVNTTRPGMELVVSPHKSVALLGAVGRAEDMHSIVDAETTATLDFLDGWFQERGGRRGRDQTRTATSGLTWAVTRHGTSRAGDPAVHDHVLVANIVEMGDARGGWKALDTASLRDVLHAATIVGRAAAARRAVELGYGVEADDGRSGRLRSWRIGGVPDEVCELFSKRSVEIDDFVDHRGQGSYRARAIAARTTRDAKVDHAPDRLAARWEAELEGIGWAPDRLVESIERASRDLAPTLPTEKRTGEVPVFDDVWVRSVTEAVIGPESRLGGIKVLSRRDLVVEVGPYLYGQPVEFIDAVVDRILGSCAVVPLIAVTAAREQVYAPTRALAVEQAIADTVERLSSQPARPVPVEATSAAINRKQDDMGCPLTAGQRNVVSRIGAGPARVQFVVGVAGSGKTTALDAATDALEADGWHVVGASTSGQAARTLGVEAGIEARTVASLLWRFDRGQLPLTSRSVVVLDEAAMTTDDDLLRLVTATETTGARLVVVGDPVQLGAVGPGGAMAALLARHPDLVTTLEENVRQLDPGERAAIAQLRAGRTSPALAWYSTHDRIRSAASLEESLAGMVTAWDDDVTAGRSTAMLAWRRDHVSELNTRARTAAITAGRVAGPAVEVGDGFEVAAGDQLVALAPNHGAGIVTSQRLTATSVDPYLATVTVTTGDGRCVELGVEDLVGGRVGYGYATTIHRAQGATFDTCHIYADGGTHHLAYVALTRARQTTHVHCVADSPAQALEDLAGDWARPDRQRWIIDDRPDPAHGDRTPRRISDDLRHARLEAEHDTLRDLRKALTEPAGPDRHADEQRRLEDDRADLRAGTGAWADTAAGNAARRLTASHHAHQAALRRAEAPALSRRERRAIRHEIEQLDDAMTRAATAWEHHGHHIDADLSRQITALEEQSAGQTDAVERHEVARALDRRLDHLESELGITPQHLRLDPHRHAAEFEPRLGLGM